MQAGGPESSQEQRASAQPPWKSWLAVSPERRQDVLQAISEGSTPTPNYYVLLGLSALIAAFGLVANSPAVVIGAMLVSPLMTPIFGVSVGLARGDSRLLGPALVAEFGGVGLVILLSASLGALPFAIEPTPEIFARTTPTLLDLFVAALAGLAGCLATIDERISPALPGVAIATSLTPPLAASGLCLAFGAYQGAWGAFLLFTANFLAILAVSTAVFLLAGFVTQAEIGSTVGLLRRFSVAGVGLLVVTVLLTGSLVDIVRKGRMTRAIQAVLAAEMADEPTATLERVTFHQGSGRIDVLSTAQAPRVLPPAKVKRIEEALARRLGENVRLFFRFSITKDVSATGATTLLAREDLDGDFTRTALSPRAQVLQAAEQVVRELLADLPSVTLDNIELVDLPDERILVVSIQSSRKPSPEGVGLAERKIRERVGDPGLRLLVRMIESSDMSSKGRILLGDAHFGKHSPEEVQMQAQVERTAKGMIEAGLHLIVTNIDAARSDAGWALRAEAVGPKVPSPADVHTVEEELRGRFGQAFEVLIWSRTEVVVSNEGYESVEGRRKSLR